MYFKDLKIKSLKVFKRFPLTVIWVIIGSVHFSVEISNNALFEKAYRLDLIFILGVSWLIGTQFLIEQFKQPKKWLWLKIIPLALLVLFYLSLPISPDHNGSATAYIRFWLYVLAGHLFVFFAPFIKRYHKIAYWNYLKNIMIAVGRSLLYSGILFLGLVLAVLASDALFNINFDDEIYGQLFVFCLGIINTIIYLYDFPKQIQQQTDFVFNKPIVVLVKYILIPLTILYFIILYLYGLKIIIAWELPEGWLSGLITALSILGFIIHIIIHPLKKRQSSAIINKFHPWFQILLLPLLILLFIAIFRRLADYGFTEARYFLMLLDCWILGITLYLLFAKNKQMRVLPISVFVLAILSTLGPWSAFKVSLRSQMNEFKEILAQVNPETHELTTEEFSRLNSVLTYFQDHHALDQLKPIIGFNPDSSFTVHTRYAMRKRIVDSLGIKGNLKDYNTSYYTSQIDSQLHTDIAEYADFYTLKLTSHSDKPQPLQLVSDNQNLVIKKDSLEVISIKLDSSFLEAVMDKSIYSSSKEKLQTEYDIKNELGHFKVFIRYLSLYTNPKNTHITQAEIFLFAQWKEDPENQVVDSLNQN